MTDRDGRLVSNVAATGCTSDDTCYRVVDGEIQEGAPGERWTTSFRYTHEQRRRMDLDDDGNGRADLPVGPAVVDGTDVVVASGSQGILRRSGDGPWERRALLGAEPLSLAGPSWLSDLLWSPLLLFVAGIALSGFAGARDRTGHIVVAVLICWGAAAGLVINIFVAGFDQDLSYATRGPWIAFFSVVAFLVALASLHGGDRARVPTGAVEERPTVALPSWRDKQR